MNEYSDRRNSKSDQVGGYKKNDGGYKKSGRGIVGSSLGDRMREAGMNVKSHNNQGYKNQSNRVQLKSAASWEADGVDHININYASEKELGQMLEFGYSKFTFDHSIFKTFKTITGFWYYLRHDTGTIQEVDPDTMRFLTGVQLKHAGNKLVTVKVKHLHAMVMDAAYQRIKSNNHLHALMHNNELPFDMYHESDTGVRIRPVHASWVIAGYTEIQRAIQAGEEPNFAFLCDEETSDIYESVRPVISESLKRRIAEREAAKNARQQNRASENNKRGDNKSDNGASKVAKPDYQKKPRGYNYDKKQGYSILIPIFDDNTDTLFLPVGRREISLNGQSVKTGMLMSEVNLPLLELSNSAALIEAGVQDMSDIVRCSQLPNKKIFIKGRNRTGELLRLERLALIDDKDQYTIVPFWSMIVDRSYTAKESVAGSPEGRITDTLTVTTEEDGTIVANREVEFYKSLSEIAGANETSSLLDFFNATIASLENKDSYKFAILKFSLTVRFRQDTEPSLYIEGKATPIGVSTAFRNEEDRSVAYFEMEGDDAPPTYRVAGFDAVMYRGRPRTPAVTVETTNDAPVSQNPTDFGDNSDAADEAAQPPVVTSDVDTAIAVSDTANTSVVVTEDSDGGLAVTTSAATEPASTSSYY